LYHFALRVPDRRALGNFLENLVQRQVAVTGFADHNVSEAIYLPDLEGNGIEVYRDRPRDEWQYEGDTIRMATDPIDLAGVRSARDHAKAFEGMAAGTDMGHMHLHVSELATTQSFYQNVLGFDLMIALAGSALFMAVGGYHHHIGLNTWQGVGAPPPPDGSLGLRHFEVQVNKRDQNAILKRLDDAQVGYIQEESILKVKDPAQNEIHFRVGS
jgi:catechol 2,3-dioxygenase